MLANARPLVATLYNPHTQPKEDLIAGFVVRKTKFERLFRDIREAPMTTPEQHYLIQGLRGMGKTTLLLRLAYEIQNTPDLRERLIPLVFNEEEYGIGSLADLWERTAQYLEEAHPNFDGLYEAVTQLYEQPDYERRAIDTLTNALQTQGKKLLLLIDNIGDLLRKLDSVEAKRLREVLLTNPHLRVIGGTPGTLEQTHDYTKPFYDFFRVLHLPGLTKTEAIDLFTQLAETHRTDAVEHIVRLQPGRIEAVRRLTGGVIRTMILLFEIMVEENTGSVFRDLNRLLDRVTPLYKHRMDDLPAQQQKIVAALAQRWDAANARELAQAVRLESKVVSAQLKQLINNGLVEKVETNTKNHLYRLEERFFNIWYLMRFGRKTDQRVLWLVRFFEVLFENNDPWLAERVGRHIRAMESESLDEETALYLTTALADVLNDEDTEDYLRKRTRAYLLQKGRAELVEAVGASRQETLANLLAEGAYGKAISVLKRFKTLSVRNRLDMASCYLLLDDLPNAINAVRAVLLTDEVQSTITADYETLQQEYPHLRSMVYRIPGVVLRLATKVPADNEPTNEMNPELSASDMAAELIMQYFYTKANGRKAVVGQLLAMVANPGALSTGTATNELLVRAFGCLWLNQFDQPIDRFAGYLQAKGFDRKPGAATIALTNDFMVIDYLKLLLAKKQFHTALNYFQREEWQLQDRYKPLYYATLHLLQVEFPAELLRMGPELRETVDDVLVEVAQLAVDYA